MWIFYASRNKTIKVKEKKTHEVYDFFTCLLRRSHTNKNKKEGKIFKGSLWPFCLKQVILRPFIQGNFCWLIDKVKKNESTKRRISVEFYCHKSPNKISTETRKISKRNISTEINLFDSNCSKKLKTVSIPIYFEHILITMSGKKWKQHCLKLHAF